MTDTDTATEKPLKSYRVTLKSNEEYSRTFIAKSPSSARYQYWQYLDTGWPYRDYLNAFSVKCLGLLKPDHLFGDSKSFAAMCKHRNIEFAFQGMRVTVKGKPGTIVGNYGMNLSILFDGRVSASNCHPHWQITYYNKAGIIRSYKD